MAVAVLVLLGLALALSAVGWGTPVSWRHAVAGVGSGALLAVVAAIGAVLDTPPDGDAWRAAVWTLCALIAISAGGPATRYLFHVIDGSRPRQKPIGKASTVLRGGSWIGLLERAAVFATLAGGWPEGVAVALAVKGLGRYPELRGSGAVGSEAEQLVAAERFIIGTFASVLWTVACIGVARLFT